MAMLLSSTASQLLSDAWFTQYNIEIATDVLRLMNGTFDPKAAGVDTRVQQQHHLKEHGADRVLLLPVGVGIENTEKLLWFGKADEGSKHVMKADEGTLRTDLDIYKKHTKGICFFNYSHFLFHFQARKLQVELLDFTVSRSAMWVLCCCAYYPF